MIATTYADFISVRVSYGWSGNMPKIASGSRTLAEMRSILNDKWLRIIGIPAFAAIAALFFYSDFWLRDHFTFGQAYLIVLINTFIYWEANRRVMLFFRSRYPSFNQTGGRIIRQFLTSTFISLLICFLLSFIEDETTAWSKDLVWQDYLFNGFVVLIFVYFTLGVYESSYYFRKWRQSFTETEQLKKANLQSQFESLKNQVNPHFLFNSLNTLSSLIEDDPSKAVKFVDHLSKVYRYLLQNNEKELITLKSELDFLYTYFFLMKVRFGDGISLENHIPENYTEYLVPPLTLQILVENAVKHNVVSPSRPLTIQISVKEQSICVSNNLQLKTVSVPSNGMGLTNIAAKYRLLNQKEMVILPDESNFSVQLPLIPVNA